jgi:hypothetical protein
MLMVAGCLAAQAAVVPDYQTGDRAEADVVTPVPLMVFDAARTESLRRAEAQKVSPVFRYWPAAGRQTEERLTRAFAETRTRFAEGLERLFGHPLPLLTAELSQPQFAEFLGSFREQHAEFPLSANLAELWALGDPGDLVSDRLLARLSAFTNSYVRGDVLPLGEKLAPGLVRLMAVEQTNAPLTLVMVDKQGRNLARSNLVTLTRARQMVTRNAGDENRAAAEFVAGFLQPNCFLDEPLTRQARARRIESINAADRYEAGQLLVRQGELVTARIRLALDELRARTEPDRAQAAIALERSRAEAESARALLATQAARQTQRQVLIGLGTTGALGLLLLVVWGRRRAAARRSASSLAMAALGSGPQDEGHWRERAMHAEARAEKATALLRANLLPHLARWMMNEVMQRLLSQRSETRNTQQLAELEVAELAERLASVHAPLAERLQAYERRIAELEAELAAKGEQNLELIKAKIETTRKRLEGERPDEPLNWN